MASCSIVKLVHGSSIILDYTDQVDEPFAIDGNQVVDAASFLRAVAVRFFPRGNEQHTVTFTKSKRNENSPTAGMREAIEHSIQLPRDEQDLKIYINDGSGDYYILHGSVIAGWNGTGGRLRDTKAISILGGTLTSTAEIDPLENWEGQEAYWENA